MELGNGQLLSLSFLLTDNSPSTQINKVVSHPTLPLTVTAHEDRHIRFFDNNSGKYKQNHTSWLVLLFNSDV